MSAAAQCANCGAGLTGRYCPGCGQDSRLRITFRAFAGQAFGGLFNLDSRLWRTLRDLCVPGKLTVEYLAGRRARYMPPVQTYLIVALLFFAVLLPGVLAVIAYDDPYRTKLHREAAAAGLSVEEHVARLAIEHPDSVAETIGEDAKTRRFMARYPWLMFVALPVFALVLHGIYISSDRLYLEHLVYAFHFQTFVFATIGLLLLIEVLLKHRWWPALPGVVWQLVGVVLLLHGIVSLRRVYRESWLTASLKFLAAAFAYLAILVGAGALLGRVWT